MNEAATREVERVDQRIDTLGEIVGQLATELRSYVCALRSPARHEVFTLTATRPVCYRRSGSSWASIGALNVNAFNVYLGIEGGIASAAGRGIAIPANTLLVLPVAGRDFEIGAAPADVAAADAVVHLFRFHTVQPAYLGAWK